MSHASSMPRLRTHANYERLVALAAESHARGRDPFAAAPRDIALARLYCHAFRRHVIGAFHATRRELEQPSRSPTWPTARWTPWSATSRR
jgi:hypothetical protein